ncbi:MAG: TMEM175 family protein [Chloroflexota bacterium]|nr:TMEM175 family protein [Chloroflexota bacterium]
MDTMKEGKETGRLEAFSDGVFSVAITLLVLNIKIPAADASPIQLLGEGPMLLAYVTSFATIGVMWINHHRLFTYIKRTDTVLLLLNLLLLAIIVFIPVPTAFLADAINKFLDGADYPTAALVYSATFFLMATCFNVLWFYASYKGRLLDTKADPRAVQAISRQYRFGPLFYVLIFAVAWFNMLACIILTLISTLFFAMPVRLPPKASEKDEIPH